MSLIRHTKVHHSGLLAVTLACLGLAIATPVLPSSALAARAVKSALAPTPSAAALRAQGVQQASAASAARSTGRSAVIRATAYTSSVAETDSTPFITATGTRVRPGVVALSGDLLRRFPYGTRLMIEDLGGTYSAFLKDRVFVVEDTMNPRISGTLDIWMGNSYQANTWGVRNIRITALN
ncbi:hypothetical protein [Deinococcus sp.]|uniref:hypothetical protein n=1 Tax=Deinococcus sp. TaxID=47478 RepID=UPI003CC5C53B